MADGLFGTAPKEVVDYFDQRGTKTSWRWTDLAPHEHALGFTVARTAGFDVIDDLHAATRKAVVDRVPFEQFRDELIPVLQAKGWWGKRVVKGPDGFKEEVQLGSLRRLKTIYWANIRSAHAAGEWARTQATKDFLPYLQYKVSLAAEKRREHLSWVGTTLPVDHPWWRTHYPPNGWHCQCRVEQIGEVAAGKMPPDKRKAPPLNIRLWQDRRSGKVWRVPEGIDPGWQTNPGMTRERDAARRYSEQASVLPPAVRSSAAANWRQGEVFRRVVMNDVGYPYTPRRLRGPDYRPPDLDEAMKATGRMMVAVAALSDELALRIGAPTKIVLLSQADAAKQLGEHPDITLEDYNHLDIILVEPDKVQDDRGKFRVIRKLPDGDWVVVLKITGAGEVLLNSFRRARQDQYRKGSR